MDSRSKSEYLEAEQFSKNQDSGLAWKAQKKIWESQRQTLFATLLDDEAVDTASEIHSNENMNDKVNKPTASDYSNSVAKSNSYLSKKEIGMPVISHNVDAKSSFQNSVIEEIKPTDAKPNPYFMNNISSIVPVMSQLMYTTQQTGIQFPQWMPIVNPYQHTPVLNYAPIINWHVPQTLYNNNNNCCVETSKNIKTANTQDFTPTPNATKNIKTANTQDLTPTPNATIRCYVCDQHVVKSEFSLHLFFGALKCNDCQIKVIDCKSFRSDIYIASNCTHKHLSWIENPIEYLKSQLNDSSIADNKKVYRYIKRLKSLEQVIGPWKAVFQEYRKLKKLDSKPKIKCEPVDCDAYKSEGKIVNTNDKNCDEVLLLESYDLDQMEDAVQVIGLVGHEMFQENYTHVKSEPKFTENNHTVKLEQTIKKELDTSHDKNITKFCENKDKKFKIKSEKTITLKQKQVIKSECDDKKTNLNLINNKYLKRKRKKKKINIDKNIINECITSESTDTTLPKDSEVVFLDLPKDGNYLVTRTSIEECPMCYTKLNLYNCRVNIKLLLYTFWCQCGLKIFYVPKTPDNVDHPVKIIENT